LYGCRFNAFAVDDVDAVDVVTFVGVDIVVAFVDFVVVVV